MYMCTVLRRLHVHAYKPGVLFIQIGLIQLHENEIVQCRDTAGTEGGLARGAAQYTWPPRDSVLS